ncbi:hypothetical protein Q9L58_002839 [Maublancomyces gigas]|uniref:Uncharacterized protein n=1 Tax=Discina gigas TaxID=1032678 RepID=A0ABR3GQE6_9PEZI
MDKYNAVTLYLFDALNDLGPSDPIVFCLVTGVNPDVAKLLDVDDVEFLAEGASIVVTDMAEEEADKPGRCSTAAAIGSAMVSVVDGYLDLNVVAVDGVPKKMRSRRREEERTKEPLRLAGKWTEHRAQADS